MGGMGTWTMAAAFPGLFAAAAPICGAFIPPPSAEVAAERSGADGFEMFGRLKRAPSLADSQAIRHLPLYIVHGAKDGAVPVSGSLEIYARLQEAGAAQVTLVIYPDVDGKVGHDSWTQTYENVELYRWLLSHAKKVTAAGGGRL